ncbi:MAG: VWA domain-containing protein, partial [Clostridia bacterium]|nr:VWA domain-containing protein [Clostridia bacterium]
MKKRKLFKRAAALVMAISMIFGVFPFTTFADMKGAGDGAASVALGSVSEIVDKTATPLDENDQTTVTLTVPGEQVNLGVDIIYITGAYLDHDKVEADLMIESLLSTFTEIVGAGIPVNFGYVPFSYDDKPVMDLTSYKTLEDLESLRDDLRTAIGKASGAYGGENMENALQVAKNMLAASPLADHPERQHLVLVASGHTYNFNVGENNEIFSTVPVAIGGSESVGKYFYGFKAWMQARNKNPNSYPIPRPFSTYNDYRDWDAYWRVIDMWAKADVVAGDKVVYNISDTTDPSFTYENWYTTAYLNQDGVGSPYKSMGLYIHTATQIALDNGYDFANAPISAHGSLIETTIDNVPAAAKHAISYERAMWEASNFIDEQITGVGINFYPIYNQMKPQYTNGVNSNADPYKYGIDWTTQYIGHSFMDMLARNAGMEKAVNNSTATNKAFFDPIKEKILYTCSEGSYVEDYIGYDAEKGNFEFIQDANTLSVKYGDIVIPAVKIETKAGATASYAFTMDGATEASFNLDYYYGDGTTTEKFIWTFHEDVSVAKRAALSYKLQLTDKATEEGTYLPNTNLSATLYPKDSNGNDGEPKVFPIPSVEYIVVDDTYNGPESHDKSKTATPLYGNRFTDVTLSVPGEVETLSTDVVFVIDKSSSDKLASDFANGLFEQLIEVQKISGASIKVGVVIFNYDGHIALELTELTEDNYQTLLDSLSKYQDGTNIDSGLILAKKMLDEDTQTDASRKHVILITDGQTWAFNVGESENSVGVPSTVPTLLTNGKLSVGTGAWQYYRKNIPSSGG